MHASMVYKDAKIMELSEALEEKDTAIIDLQERVREKDEVIHSKLRAVKVCTYCT